MKSIIIGIVIAALLIGGIAGASVLYNNLSEEYNKDHNGGFESFTPPANFGQGSQISTTEKIEETTENVEVTTQKEEEITSNNETHTGDSEINTEKPEVTTEKLDVSTENVAESTEKIEATTEKTGDATEKIEETTEKIEETTEKIEETTEKIEETTETIEETTEKIEVVFNAPDFTVLDWNGNNVKLSDYAGKPIVLNFWATWCTYCKQEMPEFDKAAKNLPDVQFIMLNTNDTMSTAKKYVESQGFEFEVLFDTTNVASHIYGVSAFPTTFFISADGSEIYYISGMISYDTLLQGISLVTD